MPLTLEQTRTLVAGARTHARENGLRVTVAGVDEARSRWHSSALMAPSR